MAVNTKIKCSVDCLALVMGLRRQKWHMPYLSFQFLKSILGKTTGYVFSYTCPNPQLRICSDDCDAKTSIFGSCIRILIAKRTESPFRLDLLTTLKTVFFYKTTCWISSTCKFVINWGLKNFKRKNFQIKVRTAGVGHQLANSVRKTPDLGV